MTCGRNNVNCLKTAVGCHAQRQRIVICVLMVRSSLFLGAFEAERSHIETQNLPGLREGGPDNLEAAVEVPPTIPTYCAPCPGKTMPSLCMCSPWPVTEG